MAFTTLILAAGAGTRMNSSLPKVAHPLLGKPIIRWIIDVVKSAGCEDIITVVGHEREQVFPLVADTTTVLQEEQLGTGHAVQIARPQLEALIAASLAQSSKHPPTTTLLVLCGDTPLLTANTIREFVATHKRQGVAASVLTFVADDPFGYGRIVKDATGAIECIVEQKNASEAQLEINEVNSGMYCFDLRLLLSALNDLTADNKQREILLTDTIEHLRHAGESVCAYCGDDPREMLGINTRVQLAAASTIAQERINHTHMLAGVTILDPKMVWIEPDVRIERDVELLPLTFLSGVTTIGSGSVLGPNTRVTDSTIGANCTIIESVLNQVVLEDGVHTGPRAYLRPGTIMRSGSRAGTHVEIKKSDIGTGSKVPHLSYIGDTTLGKNVNIGAGSITCNYDGQNKHQTRIDDETFIGSDTMLVAPVHVGSQVTIGAGSVITKDIPDGALAVERAEQRIIEDYHERKKKKNKQKDNEEH